MVRARITIRLRPSDWAWLTLVAGIIGYEVLFRDDLMSAAADRYRSRHPILTNAVILATAMHLLRGYPQRISWLDPFHSEVYVRVGQGARRLSTRQQMNEVS